MCIRLPARPRILLLACMLFGVVLAISGLLLVAGTQPIAAQVMVPSVCANTDAIPGTGATESAALIADCNALLAAAPLLTDTTGLNWETTRIISAWNGITFTMTRVTGLDLSDRNLTGTIPAALGNLTALMTLNLYSNTLTGTIPTELGNLTALTTLNLYSNTLTGTIPASLANLSTTLRSLRLHRNQLQGQITTTLNVLTNTVFTISGNNDISGCIPPSLWSTIPASDKTSILLLGWRGCCAGSQAVRSVDSTEPLVYASGSAHSGLVNDCNTMLSIKHSETDYGFSSMNWDTSVDMASWTAMMTDITSDTYQTGRLSLLDENRVVGLNFTTVRNARLPAALKDLKKLQVLVFSTGTLLGATIPPEWGEGFDELRYLGMGNSLVGGPIPASLGNLINLRSLYLPGNNLSGQIPPELSQLTNLATLDVCGGAVSGEIPPELGNLPTTTEIRLACATFQPFTGCHPFPDRADPDTDLLIGLSNFALERCTEGENPCYGSDAIPGWSTTTESPSLVADCNVLVGAKDSLDDSLNWSTTTPITQWVGIGLNHNVSPTQVITLDLSSNTLPLSGTIPAALGNLSTTLQSLNLGGNQLTGSIPPWLREFTKLQSLNLGDNQLTGTILVELGNLSTTLQSLNLGGNQLTGSIPPWLGKFTKLQSLSLYSNTLTGEIPQELGNITTTLQTLNLYSNTLTGTIPTELGNLSALTRLDLSNNRLTGTIPASLANLTTTLRSLRLHNNQLRGQITTTLNVLTAIEEFTISGNDAISGCIPPSLWQRIPDTGILPRGWRGCCPGSSAVRSFDPNEHPDVVKTCNVLLDVKDTLIGDGDASLLNWDTKTSMAAWTGLNDFSYPILLWDGSLSVFLYLSGLGLSGSIPPELGNLPRLSHLYLSDNNLTGTIPLELDNLTGLNQLFLGGNDLSGCVPSNMYRRVHDPDSGDTDISRPEVGLSECCNNTAAIPDPETDHGHLIAECNALIAAKDTLRGDAPLDWGTGRYIGDWQGITLGTTPYTSVQTLSISNALQGSIPTELGEIAQLRTLNFYSNTLTGGIPPALGNLSTTLTTLNLGQNNLTGGIPPWLGKFTNLQTLSLYSNTLTGTIPTELGNLSTTLTTLNLGQNSLTGGIPPWLGKFTNLQTLSLYSNTLTGTIPTELGDLRNLRTLDLRSNQLTDTIPSRLYTLPALQELYLTGNPQLSGACIPFTSRLDTDWQRCPPPPSSTGPGGSGGGGGSSPRPTCTNGTVVPNPTDNAALVRDCVLLLTNKATLEGSISTSQRLNWSETRSIETWEGVTVGPVGDVQRVLGLGLDIEGKSLQGSLPAPVNQLSGLRVLDISGNAISGRLPVGLSQLTGLEELDVSDNRLSGSIPTDLGRLANLSRLFLSGNSFSGCIPNALLGVSEQDLADVGLPFCDPVTPTPTPALTPTPTVTPIPPAGRQLFLPLVNK